MQYTWEIQDIRVGRRIHSSNRSEEWVIGYDPSVGSGDKFAIISCIDGMICAKHLTPSDVLDHLNTSKMRPIDVRHDDIPHQNESFHND